MLDVPLPAHTMVAVAPVGAGSELSGDLYSTFRYTLVNRAGVALGALDGVRDGTLEWSASKAIEGGGKITVDQAGQSVNFRTQRLFIEQFVNGIRIPRGVWLMMAPGEKWTRGRATWPVEVLCKCAALDRSKLDAHVVIPAGSVVTDVVGMLLDAAGESRGSITASTKVTSVPLTFRAGTSRLAAINTLLTAIADAPIRCDGEGAFVVEPYRRPAQRSSRYDFVDVSGKAIFAPTLDRDRDYFEVPNRVIVTSAASETTEAMVGLWVNTDPASPFSYANSDNTWVTRTEDGVEVVDQASLDAYARRLGIEGSSVASTITLEHAPIPLSTVDVPRLVYEPAGISARHYVINTQVHLDPLKLARSTVREVVDL